jgi:hypothetical protein
MGAAALRIRAIEMSTARCPGRVSEARSPASTSAIGTPLIGGFEWQLAQRAWSRSSTAHDEPFAAPPAPVAELPPDDCPPAEGEPAVRQPDGPSTYPVHDDTSTPPPKNASNNRFTCPDFR